MASKIKTQKLWNARTNGFDDVSIEGSVTSGMGVLHYLNKRMGGKPVFYLMDDFKRMSDAQRKEALISVDAQNQVVSKERNAEDIDALLAALPQEEREAIAAKHTAKAPAKDAPKAEGKAPAKDAPKAEGK